MIQMAATLELTPEDFGVTVRVTNETGHKLPSGYPEGRRVWLNVEAVRRASVRRSTSRAQYDFATAELTHDDELKIYEIHPGISPGARGGARTARRASRSTSCSPTRSSPTTGSRRGASRTRTSRRSSRRSSRTPTPTGSTGTTPSTTSRPTAETVHVTLYYQTTTKEYIEFLRDANTTNSAGQDLYDAWVAQGKAPPVEITSASTGVDVTTGVDDGDPVHVNSLGQNTPNPFNPVTTIRFSLAEKGHVRVAVYDVDGRQVRVLVDEEREAGPHSLTWDGKNDAGQGLASGVYFVRYRAGTDSFWRKAALLR